MARKYGNKKHVKLDPLAYNTIFLGEPKIGKTRLIQEVCEELVGEDGYVFLEMDKENGADAIEGIAAEDISSWDEFTDVKDDIIENRTTDYKDVKVVIVDTFDGFIDIAEEEAIRLSNKQYPDAKVKTIDAAWKGFQRGQKYALKLMLDALWEFKEVGINFIVIGHVRRKEETDAITETTYTTLTNDVEKVYFNGLKKKCHFLAMAYYDRTIVKEKKGKKGFDGKEIIQGKIKQQDRKIKFRDDALVVDSGSRFADIVPEIDFSPDLFIKALTDAIKAEQSKSGKSFSEAKKEQDIAQEERLKEIDEQLKINKLKKEIESVIKQIESFLIKNKANKDVVTPVLKAMKDNGISSLKDIEDISIANEILKFTK